VLMLVPACGVDSEETDPLEGCTGAKCDQIIDEMVCGLGDEGILEEDLADPGAPAEGGEEGIGSSLQGLQSRTFQADVVIGQDVVNEVGQILEKRAREEVRRQGGDLAYVDLTGRMSQPTGGQLDEQLKTVASAFVLPLELANVHINFYGRYSYSQVRRKVVDIVGRLMQAFPYRGKVRWRIGCRVEAERGIVYRRMVSPMIDGALHGFQQSVNQKISGFLSESGLQDRVSAAVATTNSCPQHTTLMVSSPSGDFEPYAVSWDQAKLAAQKLRQILESLGAP
jgi:hypothetical protein